MFSKNLKAKCHAASALKTVKSTCDSSNYLKVKKKKKWKFGWKWLLIPIELWFVIIGQLLNKREIRASGCMETEGLS